VGAYFGFVAARDEARYQEGSPISIDPVPDDRPYYYHQERRFAESRAGAVLFDLLKWLALFSLVPIILPLPGGPGSVRDRTVLAGLPYFGAIGLGFICVEIVLIQHLILYLGHPAYSVSVVLVALLVGTGMGSLAYSALGRRLAGLLHYAPSIVAIVTFVVGAALPGVLARLHFDSLTARAAVVFALIAPVGFVMGFPFPRGLEWIRESRARLVPWAWAINAMGSVLGSVIAVILAIQYGFQVVFAFGAASYLVAQVALILGRGEREAPRALEGRPGGVAVASDGGVS
jgi:hypothetical protein